MADSLNNKIINATKWSAVTEILSKLVTPITFMVMARLLTPEAYGVVATFSIVITLAEIFSDAGFQRYLIQHEFKDEEERDQATNVAFWSNLIMSFALWGLIVIFNRSLASLVGSPGLGNVLIVACAGIPLTGFCSIQMSLMKRDFDFKTLFWLRLVSILIPIFVTIPLAFWLRSYWALVLGNLVANIANALFLFFKSSWRPRFYFNFVVLHSMFSFCVWSLLDSLMGWATSYVDIFFVGKILNSYYLGLYQTTISLVGQIVALITAIVLPVLLPALSRLQDDIPEMRYTLLKFQKITGIVLIPLGVGIFFFQDLITNIMLGQQWTEAAGFIGLWGLMEAITVVFARFCSPVYSSIGKPRIAFWVQFIHFIVLIPSIIIAGQYGFKPLYITRSLIRIEGILVNMIAVYIMIKQSPWKMITNVAPEFICSTIMAIVAYLLLSFSDGTLESFVWLLLCIVVYLGTLYFFFPKERCNIDSLLQTVKKTFKRS